MSYLSFFFTPTRVALSLLTSGAVPHPVFRATCWHLSFCLLPSCCSVILSSFSTLTLCLDSWCEDGSESTQEMACDEKKKRCLHCSARPHCFKGDSTVGIEEGTASDRMSPSPLHKLAVRAVLVRVSLACPVFLEGAVCG